MKYQKYCIWIYVLFFVVSLKGTHYFSVFDGQSVQKDYYSAIKMIARSGNWNMKDGGTLYPKISGPAIQIKSSGVVLDFQNYALRCHNADNLLITAIEVGYSKAELDANPNLQQISSVTIQNASLIDFDVGIIVHQGVNSLTIDNCTFDGVSVGIIFLGTNGNDGSLIRTLIKDCTIIGHGVDKQEKLAALKSTIESLGQDKGYGYTKDSFMPLGKDLLDNNSPNVHSYAGIIANYVYGLRIEKTRIQNMGYRNFKVKSEGDTRRTAVMGIYLRNCADIILEKNYIYYNSSEISSVGISLWYVRNVQLRNIDIVYQRSACRSCGIEALDIDSLNQSEENSLFSRERTIAFDHVQCDLNISQAADDVEKSSEESFGVYIQGVFSVQANALLCEGINGKKKSYGLYGVGLTSSLFTDCVFSQNKSNSLSNDIQEEHGIVAFGGYFQKSNNLTFNSCQFSNNIGKNTGIGVLFKDSQDIECNDCQFNSNKGLTYKKNESEGSVVEGSIRNQQDRNEISNHAPVVESACTGGYGFCAQMCKRLALKSCEAKNNSGHRAIGYDLRDSKIIHFEKSLAYYQYAYGNFVHNDIALDKDGGVVPSSYAIPVIEKHKPLLFNTIFSELFSDKEVSIKNVVDDFLLSSALIRQAWVNKKTVPLDKQKVLVTSLLYISSLLSRFRLWGVSYGMRIHNGKGILIKDCQFGGQISQRDNASGIVLSGRCSDFYIEKSEMSYNYGWTDSGEEEVHEPASYTYRYDFSAIVPFWNMVIKSYDASSSLSDSGFSKTDTSLIIQGQKELDGSGNDISVVVQSQKRTFINSFAPVSSGLTIGDSCHGGTILDNTFHGNKGFAGYCIGLLFHAGDNFLVRDNIIDDNGVNIYGNCCGLLDLSLYSDNSYIKNCLSFNRVDSYYNAHSLVLSDTRSNLSLVYPKMELNNGQSYTSKDGLENIEIMFPMISSSEKSRSKKNQKKYL